MQVLTRPFRISSTLREGVENQLIKQDLLNIDCFNKWIDILKHLFPDTLYDRVSE